MTGIMMPYLLHRLQFTNIQKGKPILLPLSCQPRKTFCLSTQHPAAAVSSPVVGDLFTGPGEKVKMADPPFGQSIQPARHVTFSHQLHVRQKSVPLHRHSGIEIGRTTAPGIAQPVEHPRPCSGIGKQPCNTPVHLLAVAQSTLDAAVGKGHINSRQIHVAPPFLQHQCRRCAGQSLVQHAPAHRPV